MNSLNNEYARNFLSNIAWLRRSNGLSKRKMARRLGISVSSLNKMKAGVLPNVSVEVFFNIEKSFGIEPKDQFTRHGDEAALPSPSPRDDSP